MVWVLKCATKKVFFFLSLLSPVLFDIHQTVGWSRVLPFSGKLHVSEYLMGLLRAKLFIRVQLPVTKGKRGQWQRAVYVCLGEPYRYRGINYAWIYLQPCQLTWSSVYWYLLLLAHFPKGVSWWCNLSRVYPLTGLFPADRLSCQQASNRTNAPPVLCLRI